jgi:alginate production protein
MRRGHKPGIAVVLALLLAVPAVATAQFQLPQAPPGAPAAPPKLPAQLTYQYGYASESEVRYRRDVDLDRRLRDNSLLVKPQVSGIVVYRPQRAIELTLEMIAEKEFALQEEAFVTLPSGETQSPRPRHASLLVDQAFIGLRPGAGFELAAGRKNYEDERHWLYDTSMDIGSVAWRQGTFRAELVMGREVRWDLDLAAHSREPKDRNDTAILYADYRGIEDLRLAAYTLARHDRTRQEGRPRLIGVRALGVPSDRLNYWGELAWLRGRDEASKPFDGRGFDLGATYRFINLRFHPNVTIGYAAGSGDANPDDARNHEFRQSGLHSNETRMGGITKFKVYGEALDPELSNLRILTAGFGWRPTPTSSVDIVLHRYRLDEIGEELRGSALTALMNQAGTSRDVGKALDVVLAFRNVFGVRRLGIDIRAGWFSPGQAFLRNEGDEDNPSIRKAHKAFAVVAKIWY